MVSNLILIHNHVPRSDSGPWTRRLQWWEICQRGEGYGSVLWSTDSEWQDPAPVSLCETGPLYLSLALTLWPLTPSCQVILIPRWPAMKPESTLGGGKLYHQTVKTYVFMNLLFFNLIATNQIYGCQNKQTLYSDENLQKLNLNLFTGKMGYVLHNSITI